MKLNRALTTVAVFSALTVLLSAHADGVNLKRQPKADDAQKYTFTLDFDAGGTAGTFSADLEMKIKSVSADGYSLTNTMSNGTAKVGGSNQKRDIPAYTITADPFNKVLKAEGEDSTSTTIRLSRLVAIVVPDKALSAGDTWTATYEAETSKELPKQENSYKLESVEDFKGQKCAKITFDHLEKTGDTPAEVKGTAYVRVTDGVLINLESEMTNLEIEGFALSGKLNQILQGLPG